jgi:hypothetical protein
VNGGEKQIVIQGWIRLLLGLVAIGAASMLAVRDIKSDVRDYRTEMTWRFSKLDQHLQDLVDRADLQHRHFADKDKDLQDQVNYLRRRNP